MQKESRPTADGHTPKRTGDGGWGGWGMGRRLGDGDGEDEWVGKG